MPMTTPMNRADHASPRTRSTPVTAALALALCAGSATAQVWTVNSATLDARAEGLADRGAPAPDTASAIDDTMGPEPFVPGFAGADLGQFVYAKAKLLSFTCPLRGSAYGDVLVSGVGTDTLRLDWWIAADTKHNCWQFPAPYLAFGDVLPFLATINVDIAGVPFGTPVTVSYAWQNRTVAKSRDEAAGEDDALVSGTALIADGVELFGAGGFAFDVVDTQIRNGRDTGSFTEFAGFPWDIAVSGEPFALISSPGAGPPWHDKSVAYQRGRAIFRLGSVATPIPECPRPEIEFSLDIGSDAELSDPSFDGDEVFDPGDVYLAGGPFSPVPFNGALDDTFIFGAFDHEPDPLGPLGPPNSAPVCTGAPVGDIDTGWFDLDGTDRTDFDIRPLIDAGGVIPAFPSPCVHRATNLAYSYDDDAPGAYTGAGGPVCDIPTLTPSPGLVSIFGVSSAEDEIHAALLSTGATPVIVGASYGAASEEALHPNLAPNPDAGNAEDDDVDALDITAGPIGDDPPAACDFRYFSADHEALSFLVLDPGDIYLALPGGAPALAVDDVFDLGLSDETDLDAFEFALHSDPGMGGPALVVLFSVDTDDPLTPIDESGGLDPAMVYVSWMTGFSVPFLDEPLDDDVDALAVFCEELPPPVIAGACCFSCAPAPAIPCPDASGAVGPACLDLSADDCALAGGTYRGDGTSCADAPFPCQCPGDINGDGFTDVFDFGDLASSFGSGAPGCATRADGDLNCDGVVDVFDFADLASNFGCDSN